jgi:hypothetical protein
MQDKEQWEQLTRSYDGYFRFARTMEMGLPIVTALEFLTNEELFNISHLLANIANLLDDEVKEKKSSSANVKRLISELNQSHNKDMVVVVFRSLSNISKGEVTETKGGPRTGKSPRRLYL